MSSQLRILRLLSYPSPKYALSVCAIALFIGACGQSGPLYLPADQQQRQGGLKIDSGIQYDADGRPLDSSGDAKKPKPPGN